MTLNHIVNLYIQMSIFKFNLVKLRMPDICELNRHLCISVSVLLFLFVTCFPLSYSQQSNLTSYGQHITVQINKILSNGYSIVDDQGVYIHPFFETSYVITGSNSSLNRSHDIIISTIIDDFSQSPTYGYILANAHLNNNSTSNNNDKNITFMPSPFATPESINQSLNHTISDAISNAIDLSYFNVGIKCDFGSNITNWSCASYSTPG